MEDVQERRRALRRLDDHLRSSGIYEPVIACQLHRACAVLPRLCKAQLHRGLFRWHRHWRGLFGLSLP